MTLIQYAKILEAGKDAVRFMDSPMKWMKACAEDMGIKIDSDTECALCEEVYAFMKAYEDE